MSHLERVRDLRRQGKTRREIRQILGITQWTLNAALRDEPLREGATRPRAKDNLRAKARELRLQGLGYDEIAAQLGVSKSSISLWVRDLPRPERLSDEARRERSAEGVRRYWQAERRLRESERAFERDAITTSVGELTDRETLIAGAIAYWCEGTKDKPHRRVNTVAFINSDPGLIRLFLRFLRVAGVPLGDAVFRLSIHESADINTAEAFWLGITGADPEQFRRPTLKPHNPSTTRKNIGTAYHGCLKVEVRRSSDLYRKIEGWANAAISAAQRPSAEKIYVLEPLPEEDLNLY